MQHIVQPNVIFPLPNGLSFYYGLHLREVLLVVLVKFNNGVERRTFTCTEFIPQ